MPVSLIILATMALCCYLVDRLLAGYSLTGTGKAISTLIVIVLVLLCWYVIPIRIG